MLFALVFGALSVALMFVSEKFLSTGGGDFDSPAFAAGSSGSSGGNSAEPSGFKPASLGEMTKKGGSGDVLDDLPDFGGLAGASGNSSPAAGVSAPPVAPSPSGGGSASTSENAALMAQAIRTVLAKEDG